MNFEPKDAEQEAGLKFLLKHSYSAMFCDPGWGKTPVSLMGVQILKDAGMIHRTLVLATVDIIYDVWPEEIEKFDNIDLTYAIVHGNERQRMKAMDLDADIYLSNYENVAWLAETYGKKMGIDNLIVDESSKFRNWQNKRFRAIRRVLEQFKRRTILTGTPIPKTYLNLWPQMFIVDAGESLGRSVGGYKLKYFEPCGYKGYDWRLRDGAEDEIDKAIAHRVYRGKRRNTGKLEFYDIEVTIPDDAMKLYRELETEFCAEWKGKDIEIATSAQNTQKFRQIANGAIYIGKGKHRKTEHVHDKKLNALIELIEELQGAPLLLAYEYKSDIEAIAKEIKKRLRFDIVMYGGKKDVRKDVKDRWNKGDIRVLAGQINSLSHGLNMQYGGCNAALFGIPTDYDAFEQFYQRVWRDGQVNPVNVYILIARDTWEEKMAGVLVERGMTQKKFLGKFEKAVMG